MPLPRSTLMPRWSRLIFCAKRSALSPNELPFWSLSRSGMVIQAAVSIIVASSCSRPGRFFLSTSR